MARNEPDIREARDVHQLRKRRNWPAGLDEVWRGGGDRARDGKRVACGARGGRRADRAFPQEALAQLKAGNERFVSHPELCTVDLAQSRSAVAGHQAPWATIVACADSRVPPELIFGGHGVGELFIARDAGNLVDVGTLGTIEYGAASSALRSS